MDMMSQTTDAGRWTRAEEVAGHLQEVERAAFEAILREQQQWVGGLVYRLIGWSGEVEDVVQEVFLSAYESWGRYRGDGSVRSWLGAIAVNKCRRYHRRTAVRLKFLKRTKEEAAERYGDGPEIGLMDRERLEQVQKAMTKLRPRDREVLVLRYLEEMDISRIAEILAAPANVVNVRLTRARQRLRAQIEKRTKE